MSDYIANEDPKCTICHGKNHHSGRTDACQHTFCYNCLKKLSKRESKCPICGERFKKVMRARKEAKTSKKEKKVDKMDFQKMDLGKQYENESASQVEQNIFSILTGPQTRNNHIKLLQLYSIFDELIQE